MGQPAEIDVQQVMQRIRNEVAQELEGSAQGAFKPRVVQTDPSSPILYSDELNFLNANWQNWAEPTEPKSHRKLVGPLVVRFKRFIGNIIWNSFLSGYFNREREFQMQLVRHLNNSARYIDARDKELFWQLIKKIDSDVSGVLRRADRTHFELGERLKRLEAELELLKRG